MVLIGQAGFLAAGGCFLVMCFIGFLIDGKPLITVLEYIITAITILAVAVPEGLCVSFGAPLHQTYALSVTHSLNLNLMHLRLHLLSHHLLPNTIQHIKSQKPLEPAGLWPLPCRSPSRRTR